MYDVIQTHDSVIHLVPGDGYEHETSGFCHCAPVVHTSIEGIVYIHRRYHARDELVWDMAEWADV